MHVDIPSMLLSLTTTVGNVLQIFPEGLQCKRNCEHMIPSSETCIMYICILFLLSCDQVSCVYKLMVSCKEYTNNC